MRTVGRQRVGRRGVQLTVAALGMKAVGGGLILLAGLTMIAGSRPDTAPDGPSGSLLSQSIDPIALASYRNAAHRCAGLEWTLLAAIGEVETRHGSIFGGTIADDGNVTPPVFGPQLDGSGVGGNTTAWPIGQWLNWWGLTGAYQQAMGPMQFMPDTWARLGVDQSGDGVADPHNIHDAAASAADLLCAAGVASDEAGAIRAYNNSAVYVADVQHLAVLYAESGGSGSEAAYALSVHPRVVLSTWAHDDLVSGVVDPRLVATLLASVDRFTLSIGYFRTNHARCVAGTGDWPDCQVSNHWVGQAVDIGAVNGMPVGPDNAAARALVDWWFPPIGFGDFPAAPPENLGSPWGDVFGFSDSAHQDHLHVAFLSPPPRPS